MDNIMLSENDEIVIKLLHYFVTEKNYSPIVLKGAQNEIWLENLDCDYKVVRLVSNYIHNDEQLTNDLYRTEQIMKRIKKKTMSFSMNALSIFVNLGDNVNLGNFDSDIIKCAEVNEMSDVNKYKFIIDEFPEIEEKTTFTEKGIELFVKLTGDIGKKNEKDAKEADDVFSRKEPTLTKVFIVINFVVFCLSFLLGSEIVISFGANYAPFIKNGEIYRLITSGFIHTNLIHFLMNMYALYIIGPQIESFYGKRKYAGIYIGSIIFGNLLSMIFNAQTVSIGASGGIFGLLGALLCFGYYYRVYLDSVIKSQIIPLIALNLCMGFVLSGIDNAAHIGGLIGGILLSMALGIKHKSEKSDKINGWVLTTIFGAFLIYLGFIR